MADPKKRSPERTKIGLNEELYRGESGRRFGAAEQQVISRRQSLNSRDEQTQTFRLPAHMKRSNISKRPNPNQLIIKGTARELKKLIKQATDMIEKLFHHDFSSFFREFPRRYIKSCAS